MQASIGFLVGDNVECRLDCPIVGISASPQTIYSLPIGVLPYFNADVACAR